MGILFARADDCRRLGGEAPACFVDLNLDQFVAAVTSNRDEYQLQPFFFTPLATVDAVRFRHEVFRDLAHEPLLDSVVAFAQGMRQCREQLRQASRLHERHQKNAWFLQAVASYCATVRQLAADLAGTPLASRGLQAFRDDLHALVNSVPFLSLDEHAGALQRDLAAIRYTIRIESGAFTVDHYDGEADYGAEVEATFARFQQGAVRDYRVEYHASPETNPIEAKILEFVALLHPHVFSDLDAFHQQHVGFVDEGVATFDRELQFYLAYLEFIEPLKAAGLRFCYPQVSDGDKSVDARDTFDLALAHKLVADRHPVVCNDFFLADDERIIVVTGPNQGGKTTFSRCFGQLYYLAKLGCPVPGSRAHLFLCDQIFTHFERSEKVENLQGKLETDLIRLREILDQATPSSVVILNEIFTSTTLQDALFLSQEVMEKILAKGALCAWVTFIDELATFSREVVSMVSLVDPDDPARRTFKIVRRAADGLAHAMAIAELYRLTYDQIRERLAQ